MNNPENRDQGLSRMAHLRKVVARDATGEVGAPPTAHENEIEALTAYMNRVYPGWEEPPPPPVYPETLKGCKRLEVKLREQATAPGKSKRTRKEARDSLDLLQAHMQATFPA